MLRNYKDALIPRDTPNSLVDFIFANMNDRFTYILYIETAENPLMVEDVYFTHQKYRQEICVKTLRNSYARDFHMYAFDHLIAVIPNSAKRRKENDAGWIRADAQELLKNMKYPSYTDIIKEWLQDNPNVTFEQRYAGSA